MDSTILKYRYCMWSDLIAAGADNIPLIYAIDHNQVDIVRLLILAGVDVNKVDPNTGETPLIEAVTVNNIEIVRILIEAGADLEAKTHLNGYTALVISIIRKCKQISQLLIDHGANTDFSHYSEWTQILINVSR